MLKKIKKIKGLGIFQDFTAKTDLQEFVKFNLIYGWNGCGKTTLTRLLNSLSTKVPVPSFPSCEFEIELDENKSIKHNTLTTSSVNISVFNQEFVEDNIDWKKHGAKSIVVIAEEKIEERNRLLEIRDKLLPIVDTKRIAAGKTRVASEKERDDFLSDLARGVKNSFTLIDTSDRHYFNYDRTKLKAFIHNNEAQVKDANSILKNNDLEALSKKVRPIQLSKIDWKPTPLDIDGYSKALKTLNSLLKTNVVNKSIIKLQENSNINEWVKTGLELHKELKTDDCQFCGQRLPESKMAELELHFSKEYSLLMERLASAKKWVQSIPIDIDPPNNNHLYEEFQDEYSKGIEAISIAKNNLRIQMGNLESQLDSKITNPFNLDLQISKELEDSICAFNKETDYLISIILQHNSKTENFEKDLNLFKFTLELHYVAEGLQKKRFFNLTDRIDKEKRTEELLNKQATDLIDERNKLEASLANVSKGASDFNKELHSFLGRNDISLEYDPKEKGYRIIRTGSLKPATNLSEGEKTAIAFVYFITKLCENGNKIEDSIVVIDDPISSFDSNHLFHSLAFLKRKCENTKQLFILTHNFQYFKMVRDWILNKNKRDKPDKSRLFTIEIEKGNTRKANINNAHDSIKKFGSEYQYLFRKLLEFKDEDQLDIETAYQVANYSRKLLEGFFKFKHPMERNDFYQLMEVGCTAGKVEPDVLNKVYKFINKYSHNEAIDFLDSPVDNLLAEGDNIAKEVLEILSKCDKIHFTELEELCKN